MGFRPQPRIEDNLIRVTNDREQQTRLASSLRLYRDGKRLARSFVVLATLRFAQFFLFNAPMRKPTNALKKNRPLI